MTAPLLTSKMSSQSSTGPKCSICDVTFRRPEHLKRHLRSHTKEKPFQCAHCSRRFSRSDTLHRHDQSYHAPGVSDRIHRITVKTFRACSECAFARVRCSGGEPCHRCQSRTTTCQYPTDRRSKRQGTSETSRKSTTSAAKMSQRGKKSSTSESTVENSRRPATSDEMQASRRPENDQQFQFRFINYNTSSQTNSINHETEPRRQSLSYNNGYAPNLNFNAQSQSPQVQARNDSQVSFESSSPEAASSQTAAVLPPFNVASQMLLNQTSLSQVQSPVNAAMPLDMPPATNTLDMSLDPVLFSAVEDLGLNWLPIDDFKDISAPLSMDPNATYGVMNEWWLDGLNARQDLPQSAPAVGPIPMLNGTEQSASFPLALTPSSHSLGNPSQNTSPSSSNDETSSCGQYYVDGEGARLTKQKRRRNHHMESPEDSEHTSLQHSKRPRLMFPLVNGNLGQELNETGSIRYMPSSTYERILDMFDHFCRSQSLFPAFEPTAFLGPDLLAVLSTAYLDEFQPVYPIFHMPTFDLENCHWILALTMAAIGSSLLNTSVTAECAFPLHEFARRAILIEKEKHNSDPKPLWLIQAMLLNCIGLYHGADDQAKDFCLGSMHELVRFAHQEGLIVGYQADKRNGISWNEWIEAESRRRTGYCIWLVDSTLAYTAPDYRPLFTLKDAQAPLPSHESIWDAASEEDWKSLYTGHNLSLHSATEVLFIEKRTIPNLCEFDHTLLLHALYQRLWEVSDYYQSPLTCWDPNAARQPRETVISSSPVWLPGVPMYSKWRNSACDCLDTLHWHANGVIAKAAGFEHPTVLHLHAARVVLLVPFREIRKLATSLATGSISWDSRLERNPDWQVAWRWVRHDQYKARLSIIHAGSVFWHVRRYSTNAFQEPISVFLATLALWAYGICSYNSSPPPRSSVPIGRDGQQLPPTQATHHTDQAALDASNPTFIHLDRPCDDEIVQLYVREGQTMRGNVTGVGDICSLEGPSRVLKEGIRILSSLASTWRITHTYIDILTKLRDRTSMPISATT